MSGRPRLLLVPSISELEWGTIRPRLEEWAEVAAFSLPGLDREDAGTPLSREACIARGHTVLTERGWDDAIFVGDQFGSGLAVSTAERWQGSVRGLALGHACLRYTREGERPTLSSAVVDFQLQLVELGPTAAKSMFVQVLEVAYGADVAAVLRKGLREDFAIDFAHFLLANQETDLAPMLRELDVPLLLAEHIDCGLWTAAGFEDATLAFPDARTTATADNPGLSLEFAEELKDFATDVYGGGAGRK